MFLLRSIFWLALAFIILRPDGFEDRADIGAIKEAAIKNTQLALVENLGLNPCNNLECSTNKTLKIAATFVSGTEKYSIRNGEETDLQKNRGMSITNHSLAPIPKERIKKR